MKKIGMVSAFMFAALLFSQAVPAEEPQPVPPVPQVGAPPEMKQIAMVEGPGDLTIQMRMDPKAPWTETKAVSVNKLILDGCAMEQSYSGELLGLPFSGVNLTCYSRALGKWQNSWIDNLAGAISLYEGDFVDGKLTVAGVDKMPGMTVLSRSTTYNITPKQYEWLMENSFDNGTTWLETMKAVFTKR